MNQTDISDYGIAYEQAEMINTFTRDIEENLNSVKEIFRGLDYPNWSGQAASHFATITFADTNQYDSNINGLYEAASVLQQMLQNYQSVDNSAMAGVNDLSDANFVASSSLTTEENYAQNDVNSYTPGSGAGGPKGPEI